MNAAHAKRLKCRWLALRWYLVGKANEPETAAILADYYQMPERLMREELVKRYKKGARYARSQNRN